MLNDINTYKKKLEKVIAKSGGKVDKMNYSDKVIIKNIMCEIKQEIDAYMQNDYAIIEKWATIDEKELQLHETKADLSVLKL